MHPAAAASRVLIRTAHAWRRRRGWHRPAPLSTTAGTHTESNHNSGGGEAARTFTTLQEIVEHGYCLSCGLCTQVVPDGVIGMALTPGEQLRPRASRALTAEEEARIVRVCPGVSVTGSTRANANGTNTTNTHNTPAAPGTSPSSTEGDHGYYHDPVWGDIRGTFEGWASDPATRARASAGGVMSAVNRYLLESGRASFILQLSAGTVISIAGDEQSTSTSDTGNSSSNSTSTNSSTNSSTGSNRSSSSAGATVHGRADVGPVLGAHAPAYDAQSSAPVMVRDVHELLIGSQSRYSPAARLLWPAISHKLRPHFIFR